MHPLDKKHEWFIHTIWKNWMSPPPLKFEYQDWIFERARVKASLCFHWRVMQPRTEFCTLVSTQKYSHWVHFEWSVYCFQAIVFSVQCFCLVRERRRQKVSTLLRSSCVSSFLISDHSRSLDFFGTVSIPSFSRSLKPPEEISTQNKTIGKLIQITLK